MSTPSVTASHPRIQQRVANQERRIEQGLKSGTLTQAEAAPLQERLGAVKAQMADGFEKGEGKNLKKALNGLSKDIHSAKHNDAIDPQKRSANIDARIAQGLKDGSLTQTEADSLTAESTAAKTALAQATTPEAKLAAAQQLESLSKKVHVDRHDGEMDGAKRVQSFSSRIAAGLGDGSLTTGEATRLGERLGGVSALATNGVTDAKMVNQLNRAIYRARHNDVA
jgi:phosphoenolpyruvate-protein kinase (PTS system EI component)